MLTSSPRASLLHQLLKPCKISNMLLVCSTPTVASPLINALKWFANLITCKTSQASVHSPKRLPLDSHHFLSSSPSSITIKASLPRSYASIAKSLCLETGRCSNGWICCSKKFGPITCPSLSAGCRGLGRRSNWRCLEPSPLGRPFFNLATTFQT